MTLASTYSFKHFDFLQLHAISSAKFSTFSIKACGVNIPENIKSRFRGWTRNYSANTSCSAPVIHGTRPPCPPKLLRTSCPSHRRNLFSGRAALPPCWTEQVSFPLTATVIRIDQPQINTRNSAKRFADLNCCDEVGVSRASRARACVYVRVCVGVESGGPDRIGAFLKIWTLMNFSKMAALARLAAHIVPQNSERHFFASFFAGHYSLRSCCTATVLSVHGTLCILLYTLHYCNLLVGG
jgi:hypothetical protein